MTAADPTRDRDWPPLPYGEWKDTRVALHLMTQIVGKVRLAHTPWLNHSWHVTLSVTSRGLTTGPIPHGRTSFEIAFDFIDHRVRIETSAGGRREIALQPMSVADFYAALMGALDALKVPVKIIAAPNEIADVTPFPRDTAPRAYDPDAVNRFWRVLVQADRLLRQFRTGYLGKSSPVQFFWGSFDLAVTRFSGRRAPAHPGGVPHLPDAVVLDAYSHEVSSAGFWPGGGGFDQAAFYAYAYPEPAGFRDAGIAPAGAGYDAGLGEFLLPYDVVRTARDPDRAVLEFLQSTYDATAKAGGWDRAALECGLGQPGVVRPV